MFTEFLSGHGIGKSTSSGQYPARWHASRLHIDPTHSTLLYKVTSTQIKMFRGLLVGDGKGKGTFRSISSWVACFQIQN
jgi:hypothetical protein